MDFDKCTNMNNVLTAESDASSLALHRIDFDQPREISINFWFKGHCQGQTMNCMIIDGPF